MRKHKLLVLILVIAASLFIVLYYKSMTTRHTVSFGETDLGTQRDADNIIPLNGTWEFYWGQLLEPPDFYGEHITPAYMKVPGGWNEDIYGEGYPDHGIATYRVVIKNIKPKVIYGIKKQSVRVASKIYINGKLLYKDGIPSESMDHEVMGNRPAVIYFKSESSIAEIIIQVSSHKYSGGGIADPVYFGEQQAIMRKNESNIIHEAVRISFMLGVGVIYILLALCIPTYRKQEPAAIVFPIAVLFFMIINTILGERLIFYFLPWLSSEGSIRLEIVIIYLYTISMGVLLNRTEEKLISKGVKYIIIVLLSIMMVGDVLFPDLTYQIWLVYSILDFFIFFGLGFRILYLYLTNQALHINQSEHIILIIIFFSVNIYDIDILLFTAGVIGNSNLAQLFSIIYIMAWLLFMIYRYQEIFLKNEALTVALLESNYNTEKITNHAMRSEIAFLQAQIKPHFLFNSLSSIMNLCQTNPSKAVLLLGKLSEFLKGAFQVDMSSDYIYVESELEIIKSYVFIEQTRFENRLTVTVNIEEPLKKQKIIPLLLQPLVENAIRHGALKREEGGRVIVTICRVGSQIHFSVRDNGPGFLGKSRRYLEQENTVENQTHDGRAGVGITNIRNRLRYFYSETLHIEELEEGVDIWFVIPLSKEAAEYVTGSHC